MTIGERLREAMQEAAKDIGCPDIAFVVEPADLQHGDYATNIALVAGKVLKKNPRELAELIAGKLKGVFIKEVTVAGPGFINIHLSDKALAEALTQKENIGWNESLKKKKYIVEYTDPNPFKEFHIGHLMSNAVGETVSRLIEASGAETKRACYQGDVGLHVAKALWGMIDHDFTSRPFPPLTEKFMGKAYAKGANAYESDQIAKKEIEVINKSIYLQDDKDLYSKYEQGREWSLQYFERIYRKLGTKFDFYFFESQTGYWGLNLVKAMIEFAGTTVPTSSTIDIKKKIQNWVLWQRVVVSSNENSKLGLVEFEQMDQNYNKGLSRFTLFLDEKPLKVVDTLKNNLISFDLKDLRGDLTTLETGARVIALTGDIDSEFNSSFSFKLTRFDLVEDRTEFPLPKENILNASNLQSGTQYSMLSKSEGAIVYKGDETKGLHTRVLTNKEGLPTYEAKELGLAKIKYDTYAYDHSIVVTGNEVNDYFRVLLDAMSKIFPELAAKTEHIGHGMMKLPTGKMSSRTGDVITAEAMIADVKAKVLEKMKDSDLANKDEVAEEVAIGAIKYSILRQAPGKDIIFDLEQATSFEGDSGPYLQYTFARTCQLLKKGKDKGLLPDSKHVEHGDLSRFLARFPDVVLRAQVDRAPQYVVTYLIELAQHFNSYYGAHLIIDEANKSVSMGRLALVEALGRTMKSGLWMLGIKAPEMM